MDYFLFNFSGVQFHYTMSHPFLQEKIPWGLVPFVQAQLLARYIRGDIDEYPSYLWK